MYDFEDDKYVVLITSDDIDTDDLDDEDLDDEDLDVDDSSFISVPTIYVFDKLDRKVIDIDGEFQLGEKYTKKRLTTTIELRTVFYEIIEKIIYFHFSKMPPKYRPEYLRNDMINELVYQLVVDVLFDKYKCLNKMTSHEYAHHMSEILPCKADGNPISVDSIYDKMKRIRENFYNLMNQDSSLLQLNLLGLDIDFCQNYFTNVAKDNIDNKKPKYIWDAYLYNSNMITSRQYRRQIKKDGNYLYKPLCEDLNYYNEFIKKILPKENETPKNYFLKTMEYYYLESYKRVDFIFKILSKSSAVFKKIKKTDEEIYALTQNMIRMLMQRYTPNAKRVLKANDQIHTIDIVKYYMPLSIIEYEMFDDFCQIDLLTEDDCFQFINALDSYRIIRAMAYEDFCRCYEYILPSSEKSKDDKSSYSPEYVNYKEIKDFLSQYYNMQSYHDTNEIWEMIKNKDPKKDKHLKKILSGFYKLNSIVFSKRVE
ncbi:MAG: hypothetical protein NC485_14960 [Ruminococcus flavefaciens]|nr:hypothetical protein [Ruminococcus flavefaciens]